MSTEREIATQNLATTYSKVISHIIDDMSEYVVLGFDGAITIVLETVKDEIEKRRETLEDPHIDEFTKAVVKKELELVEAKLVGLAPQGPK